MESAEKADKPVQQSAVPQVGVVQAVLGSFAVVPEGHAKFTLPQVALTVCEETHTHKEQSQPQKKKQKGESEQTDEPVQQSAVPQVGMVQTVLGLLAVYPEGHVKLTLPQVALTV